MDGHIKVMAKISNRDKILTEGLRVVHRQGFGGASVRDIVQAAGVPQGSFTNHFASKEAFGLEIIDLYLAGGRAVIADTLRNEAMPPLQRLRAYIDAGRERLNQESMRDGCLFGNFAAEASPGSDAIRLRLLEIFTEVRGAIADCLRDAVKAGELPGDFDCMGVASFIVSALQGANLMAKTERCDAPVEQLKRVLFALVLRPCDRNTDVHLSA
jgi:TetR/AcrR family transcriptional repressor of nem operon